MGQFTAEQIQKEIYRLSTNRAYGLKGFYIHNGKDYKVIETKEDKGYFQALHDLEVALLGEEVDDGEIR